MTDNLLTKAALVSATVALAAIASTGPAWAQWAPGPSDASRPAPAQSAANPGSSEWIEEHMSRDAEPEASLSGPGALGLGPTPDPASIQPWCSRWQRPYWSPAPLP